MYPSRLLQVSAIALTYRGCKSEMTQLAMQPRLLLGSTCGLRLPPRGRKRNARNNK
jgi:hypothetical protein